MPMLSEKQRLGRKLMACKLAMVEANLYLDSHPTCPMGLEYFRKHKAEYEKVLAEYVASFGPVTAIQSDNDKKWEWVITPFPWERGES